MTRSKPLNIALLAVLSWAIIWACYVATRALITLATHMMGRG